MNIFDIIYSIIIGPLKLLFEFIFVFVYGITRNVGISIIALSLIMNIILLPLYNKSDRIQEEQIEIEKRLKPGIDHIKKAFKGDERYMILQTYYRQNNYNPLSVLKGSISLLLEIPFFIAAYDFLSNLSFLSNSSFLMLNDLSLSDGLLKLGTFNINILPILMTAINIISCAIYTKGQPLKSKFQLYAMALIFLILLYNRPSGLVFYYTLNNIFSLIKNIYNKLNIPKLAIYIGLSIFSILGIVYFGLISPLVTTLYQATLIIMLLLLQLPLILYFINKKQKVKIKIELKNDKFVFYACCLVICVVLGLYIPSTVINASVAEFINVHDYTNPLIYIFNSLFISIGVFLIWINVYYSLMESRYKLVFELLSVFMFGMFVINYMFFGTNLGFLSTSLKYDNGLKFSSNEILINSIALLVLGIFVFLLRNKTRIIKYLAIIASAAFIIMSIVNINNINSIYIETKENYINSSKEKATLSLSKDNNNVVVIILDRSVNSYFPYLLEENEKLQKQFAGFTYYPNTISFARTTKLGIPAIYGGYEYSPDEINKRSSELLSDKHDEALKVMPTLFSDNNYDVTIFDMPYVNYKDKPASVLFEGNENIETYETMHGMFSIKDFNYESSLNDLNRNLFCFSLMKIMPISIQPLLYDGGEYHYVKYLDEHNVVINDAFIDNYAVLNNLVDITDTTNENGRLCLMYNCTTHEATTLLEPEYKPSYYVNNDEYDIEHKYRESINGEKLELETEEQYQHYHINMASYIQIGEWLDYLREEGVYDNTKIIITADHGIGMKKFDQLIIDDENDAMAYNPILLVKDYNSTEFKTDYSFMTNADVISIACEENIENPINPFTKKEIKMNKKENGHLVSFSSESLIRGDEESTFIDGEWYLVKDSIFDNSNWKRIEE